MGICVLLITFGLTHFKENDRLILKTFSFFFNKVAAKAFPIIYFNLHSKTVDVRLMHTLTEMKQRHTRACCNLFCRS